MRTADLAATVFGVIFVAELPDKTAVAALVLATRYRPLPVFAGAALALTLQSLVAVAAGSLLSLLPSRPVHVGAGIIFLVSALVMWLRKESEGAAGRKETASASGASASPSLAFWRASATVFGVVFVAEWGDLTQLATAAFVARERAPVVVFIAATLALWAVTALAVALGNRTAKVLRASLVEKFAAVLFTAIGLALLFGWL